MIRLRRPRGGLVRPCGWLEWLFCVGAMLAMCTGIARLILFGDEPTGPFVVAALVGLLIRVRRLERITEASKDDHHV